MSLKKVEEFEDEIRRKIESQQLFLKDNKEEMRVEKARIGWLVDNIT